MAEKSVWVVMTTVPYGWDRKDDIVRLGLAGCVQSVGIESSYIWKGKLEVEKETLLVIKTVDKDRLVRWLADNHPYEVPEIVWFEAGASEPYLSWLESARVNLPDEKSKHADP